MTIERLDKSPFPWFVGKTDAAPLVWRALGDVPHYVEPFAGRLAVLLLRPHECNRPYYSETVNDLDGLLVNAWRAIQFYPDETADAASWPVSEADLMARHLAILKWKRERELERLMADPAFCDPQIAGWWLWGLCSWIGSGWCDGSGPWIVGADGRITRQTGSGGVSRRLPHISDDGRGVNRPQLRDPGVSRQLPHISDDGRGVNHAGTREPGVSRQRPHLTGDGRGVNSPQLKEPGVSGYTPEEWTEDSFHPMTMPELRRWFRFLSARLRHVRILNGDWTRSVTTRAAHTLPVRQGHGPAGIFLDPPYSNSERYDGLYGEHDDGSVATDVREWCLKNGLNDKFRIVLAGFAGEGHEELEQHGWAVAEWFRAGLLKGGMGNISKNGSNQQHRERLWFSPHCLNTEDSGPPGLFDAIHDEEDKDE